MSTIFNISISCGNINDRPPLSHRVREYYSGLLTQELFVPKLISIKENWTISLVLMFNQSRPDVLPFQFFVNTSPQIVRSEMLKNYYTFVNYDLYLARGGTLEGMLGLFQEALTAFFTQTFKKVKPEKMAAIWEKVDMGYLHTIPYPAPLLEQRYVEDIIRSDGTLYIYGSEKI
jgi:hypothetical protein